MAVDATLADSLRTEIIRSSGEESLNALIELIAQR
jgi:hypothetical protein